METRATVNPAVLWWLNFDPHPTDEMTPPPQKKKKTALGASPARFFLFCSFFSASLRFGLGSRCRRSKSSGPPIQACPPGPSCRSGPRRLADFSDRRLRSGGWRWGSPKSNHKVWVAQVFAWTSRGCVGSGTIQQSFSSCYKQYLTS